MNLTDLLGTKESESSALNDALEAIRIYQRTLVETRAIAGQLAEELRASKAATADAIMQRENLHLHLQQLETTWLKKAQDDRNDIQTLRDALRPFAEADPDKISMADMNRAEDAYKGTEPR